MSPSMFGLFTAGLAALAPLVSAYTTPTGAGPEGNPITRPGLNTIVPVGQPFTITWEPTTEGTVSLVLLKGPAENLIPVYAIAEKIENSGSYTWDPASTLEASEGAKGYGIQLIDDKTGQYQYTTQFGISNDHQEEAAPSSSAAAPSSYAAAPSAYASSAVSSAVESASSVVAPVYSSEAEVISTSAPVAAPATTAAAPYTIPSNATAVHSAPISFSTGVAKPTGGNFTHVEPSTGSASNVAASFGGLILAAGIAAFAL